MSVEKSNLIPLVLAVLLAGATVYAVNRFLVKKTMDAQEDLVRVVVASRNLSAGDPVEENALMEKVIPRSAAPSKFIRYDERERVLNLKMQNPVANGDYIVYDDVGGSGGFSDLVGEAQWAISVSLNGGAITSRLRPGDEIAIIGTYDVNEETGKIVSSMEKKPDMKTRRMTAVILPKVTILALDSSRQQGGDEFVLALEPHYAQAMIHAQEQGITLTPALRKRNVETNINRSTAGYVTDKTFDDLKNLAGNLVEIPEVPLAGNGQSGTGGGK